MAKTIIDRWFYFGMAVLFLLIALVGFGPRSFAIVTGALRNPPFVVHLHAFLMGLWLILFAAQTWLIATNRKGNHQRLGISALGIAPLMWIAMVGTALSFHQFMSGLSPDLANFGSNMLLSLLRSVLLFPVFLTLAISVKKSDLESHKRLMLLASLTLASGGIDRMSWLPGQVLPQSYDGTHAYQLALLLPALINDLCSRGRIHRSYIFGLALLVPWMIATHFLWGSEWWLSHVSRILGGTGGG